MMVNHNFCKYCNKNQRFITDVNDKISHYKNTAYIIQAYFNTYTVEILNQRLLLLCIPI